MPEKIIEVDLGALYEDCYLKKAMRSRGKEQDLTLERMVGVVSALHKQGYSVKYKLGNLVGALTRDIPMMLKGTELNIAIRKVLRSLDELNLR